MMGGSPSAGLRARASSYVVISLSHDVILIVIVSYVIIVESMMFPLPYVMDTMCSIDFI